MYGGRCGLAGLESKKYKIILDSNSIIFNFSGYRKQWHIGYSNSMITRCDYRTDARKLQPTGLLRIK